MYCPNCGNNLREEAVFCDKCSTAIDKGEQSANSQAQETDSPKKKENTVGRLLVTLVVMVIVFFIGARVIAPSMFSSDKIAPTEASSDSQDFLNVFSSHGISYVPFISSISLETRTDEYAKSAGENIYYVRFTSTNEGKVISMTVMVYEPVESASMEFQDLNCCTVKEQTINSIEAIVAGEGHQFRVTTVEYSGLQTDTALKELHKAGIISKRKALSALAVENKLLKQGFIKK